MEIIEKEIVEFANDLLKMYENSFNKLNIIVKEPPRIDNWNRVRNFMTWFGKPLGNGVNFMIYYNNPNVWIK